jgi:hypothetical protein
MKKELTRALSPVLGKLGSRRAPSAAVLSPEHLVAQETRLLDRKQVERHLPDILGRALARSWIDPDFRDRFLSDPRAILEEYGVFMPPTFSIAIETEGTSRPRVVVYEKTGRNAVPKRLLYLQLVMMAGK